MPRPIDITDKRLSYNAVDDKDVILLIALVKLGIAFTMFSKLAKGTPFSLTEWSSYLNMSNRTMQRYQREKKRFDPIYSEKIVQIALVYNLGIEIFGDKDKFDQWLATENLALGKRKPKELLDTSFGIGLLKDELTRIEYGVLA